jgi:hypothetical protein
MDFDALFSTAKVLPLKKTEIGELQVRRVYRNKLSV